MESLLTLLLIGTPFFLLIRECRHYLKRHTQPPEPILPKWARDKAEIKQGPLFGEDAAGYVENKMKRFDRSHP